MFQNVCVRSWIFDDPLSVQGVFEWRFKILTVFDACLDV